MIKEAFGLQLRKIRKDAGITQESLSATSGVGGRFLQEIEGGSKQPSISTIFKLAKALDTTPGALLDSIYANWKETASSEDD